MVEQIAVASHKMVAIFVGGAIFFVSNGSGNNARVVVNSKRFSYWDKLQPMKWCDDISFFLYLPVFRVANEGINVWSTVELDVDDMWFIHNMLLSAHRFGLWLSPYCKSADALFCVCACVWKSESSMQISPLFKQRISFCRSLPMQIQNGRCCNLFPHLWRIH